MAETAVCMHCACCTAVSCQTLRDIRDSHRVLRVCKPQGSSAHAAGMHRVMEMQGKIEQAGVQDGDLYDEVLVSNLASVCMEQQLSCG